MKTNMACWVKGDGWTTSRLELSLHIFLKEIKEEFRTILNDLLNKLFFYQCQVPPSLFLIFKKDNLGSSWVKCQKLRRIWKTIGLESNPCTF